MKIIFLLTVFSTLAFSAELKRDSLDLINALLDRSSDFEKFKNSSERVSVYKIETEKINEKKTKYRIIARKFIEGDMVIGDVVLEIQKNTTSRDDGPELIEYQSRIIED